MSLGTSTTQIGTVLPPEMAGRVAGLRVSAAYNPSAVRAATQTAKDVEANFISPSINALGAYTHKDVETPGLVMGAIHRANNWLTAIGMMFIAAPLGGGAKWLGKTLPRWMGGSVLKDGAKVEGTGLFGKMGSGLTWFADKLFGTEVKDGTKEVKGLFGRTHTVDVMKEAGSPITLGTIGKKIGFKGAAAVENTAALEGAAVGASAAKNSGKVAAKIASTWQATKAMPIGKLGWKAGAVSGGIVSTYASVNNYKADKHAREEMTAVLGKDSEPLRAVKWQMARRYGLETAGNALNLVLGWKVNGFRGVGKTLIASMALQMGSSWLAGNDVTQIYRDLATKVRSGAELEAADYAKFVSLMTLKKGKAADLNSDLVVGVAEQYAKEHATPKQIMLELKSGRFDDRARDVAKMAAAAPVEAPAPVQAAGSKAVLGHHTAKVVAAQQARGAAMQL